MLIKATHRLIDSVWTITADIQDGKAKLLDYNRDDPEGYLQERTLPKGKVIEGEGRVVEHLVIDGERYTVTNPKHVFDYK
jgi:hypothetical protein